MSFLPDFIGPERDFSWVFRFWPVLPVALGVSLFSTAMCKKIAIRFDIVDKPDATVKTHREPIAYLGGVGMLLGLAAGIFAALALVLHDDKFARIFYSLAGILGGAVLACGIGLLDDILDIKPIQKIGGQLVAATLLVIAGIRPNMSWFFDYLPFAMPEFIVLIVEIGLVYMFVLGATNSLNLLDGLDGLCAGVTSVITLAMLLLAVHLATWGFSSVGDPVRVTICLALFGGVLGFLPFNRHPAKIFMGDAGSMLLGFVTAALMILFAEGIPRWWLASIVVFGLPILDTAVALVRRLLNRRPLFISDRGHVYDQMIDRGISLKRTVALCYILAVIYAAVGLMMSQIRTRYAIIVYILTVVISALIIWKKGFLKMEGLRGAVRKPQEKD